MATRRGSYPNDVPQPVRASLNGFSVDDIGLRTSWDTIISFNSVLTPPTADMTASGCRPIPIDVLNDGNSPTVSREFAEALLAKGAECAVLDALADQREQSTRKSIEARLAKNLERDRRIHDAFVGGQAPKTIAHNEGLSVSQVNRILKDPRP